MSPTAPLRTPGYDSRFRRLVGCCIPSLSVPVCCCFWFFLLLFLCIFLFVSVSTYLSVSLSLCLSSLSLFLSLSLSLSVSLSLSLSLTLSISLLMLEVVPTVASASQKARSPAILGDFVEQGSLQTTLTLWSEACAAGMQQSMWLLLQSRSPFRGAFIMKVLILGLCTPQAPNFRKLPCPWPNGRSMSAERQPGSW